MEDEKLKLFDHQTRIFASLSRGKSILIIGGSRVGIKSLPIKVLAIDEIANFVSPIKDRPALSPADERKLKDLERLYQLARVRRDKVQMSSLEKQITAIQVGRLFK